MCFAAVPAAAESTAPFKLHGIEVTPYFGSLMGYSTNPDENVGGKSSGFIRYDAGLAAAVQYGASTLKAELNGTFLAFDGVDKDRRWLYEAKASGVTELTDSDLLEYDVRRRRDNLDDKYDELSHRVRSFWTHTGDDLQIRVGSTFRSKDFLEPDTHNEFDYLSTGLELTLRVMPKAVFSPFVTLKGAKIDYLNQVENIIDRDAKNYSATTGVRWQPFNAVEINFGSRYNLRETEDRDFGRIDNNYADLELHWKPSAKLDAKVAVWRELAEPYKSAGIAADQINYEFGLVLNPLDRWQFEYKSTYQWEHEIGTNVKSTDIELTAAAFYEISPSVRTFLKGRQLWETDRDKSAQTVERSQTTEVLLGFETIF